MIRLTDALEKCKVFRRACDRFWVDHPIFNNPREDKDEGKTWFWGDHHLDKKS